jgi:N6-adenosine-specific RNA methylase IME4
VNTPSKLSQLLAQLPPSRRGAAMQSVISFRPDESTDTAFQMGPIRAAFAEFWESCCRSPVPVQKLRAILARPIAIGTVLEFSKLSLTNSQPEIDCALCQLVSFLYRRAQSHDLDRQQTLFDPKPLNPSTQNPSGGDTFGSLRQLVDQQRKFATIYADPPWPYENEASRAAAANHYSTLPLADILAEPVEALAETDAHLHLWTTNAFLREAFHVIDAWGFQFKSCLVWIKSDLGMGNYWRVSHEFLLLGVRGSLTFRDRTLPSWVQAERTIHSRKPALVRSLVERVSPGPYLELYGREELPDSQWTVHGNQIRRHYW